MEVLNINGKSEIIMNDNDIVDIVRNYCGNDFARFLEDRLNKPTEITQELREEVLSESDFYSYEASLDSWNSTAYDIIEECEKQIEYMEESKRIDKHRLYKAFQNIKTITENEL